MTGFLPARQLPYRINAPQETRPNIVGTFEGAAPGKHLVLNVHIDVFSADPTIESRPQGDRWSGAIIDGKRYDRGVAAMKCGTSASSWTCHTSGLRC